MLKFQLWYREAIRKGVPLPDAMALATADRQGRPSVRFVLLKEVSERGYVFYTNEKSRKGVELRTNPHAAASFYWDSIGKQVRIEGRVVVVSESEADAYWATRPRESCLSALASCQSKPMAARGELLGRLRNLRKIYQGKPIPRPPHWKGYCILPSVIEFWKQGKFRLHTREQFTRTRQGWSYQLLQP
jgi:pyridoxamine 5'-phosphate oxidase